MSLTEKLRIYLDAKQNLRNIEKILALHSPKRTSVQEDELGNYLSSVKKHQIQKSQFEQARAREKKRFDEAHNVLCNALPFDVWVIVKVNGRKYAVGKSQWSEYKNTTHYVDLKVRYPYWLRLPLHSCVGTHLAPTDYY